MNIQVVAVVIAVLTAGYMLPWAIAVCKGSPNVTAIFWVNLLLGWTLLGWVAALIWSLL